LREYFVGLQDLKVHDYLEGLIGNPLANQLTRIHLCSVCHDEFFSEKQLNNHVNAHKIEKVEA